MDSERIILGSGKLYCMVFTGEIPEDTAIETDTNQLAHIKGGASLEYTAETYTAKDDLGVVQKTVLTSEDVTLMVAEAGPELIQMVNGQTIVTPLTPTARNTAMDTVNGKQGGSTTNEIQLKIENFYNNREQDIRELTEEILEIADQIKEREEAAYA